MVMHARKQPRLDDGYMDKRDSHLYQSNKYPSKSYSDRYSKREDGRPRGDSPAGRNSPRYLHKKPYNEKDKGRMERGAYSSPDKKVNHASTASSSHGGGSQNGSSYDKVKANHRDHKQEVQKPALRTCGDWSEHVSSSGKQYYYNTRTGVSQWEKPDDWNDSKLSRSDNRNRAHNDKDSVARNKYSSDRGSSGGGDRSTKRQGSLEFNPSLHNEKPDKHYLFQKFQDSQRQAQIESRAPTATTGGKSKDRYFKESGTVIDHSGSNSANRIRRDSDHRTPHRRHGAQVDDMDISPDTSPSSRPSSCAGTPQMGPASTPNTAVGHPSSTPSSSAPFIANIPQLINQISGGQNNQELTNKALQTLQKLQEVITRQIAQQTTRASTSHAQHSSLSTSTAVAAHPALTRSSQHPSDYNSVTPHTHSQAPQVSSPHVSANHVNHTPSPAYTSGGGVYGKLGQSQQQQQHLGHQSPYHQLHVDTSNGPYVLGSTAGQSPRSDHGQKSSCASPSSTTSSQDLPVGVGDISVTGLNQTNSPNVSSSLSQYYNEKLISHVTGWPGDQAERQARRYWEEGISVGSFHCGQVGVELKRSRSLVRLAEIQSTLHEQRILFLSTQVHELESMKAPSFSSH